MLFKIFSFFSICIPVSFILSAIVFAKEPDVCSRGLKSKNYEERVSLLTDCIRYVNLIENLHHRLSRLEKELGLPLDEAEACSAFLDKMKQDETRNAAIHTSLITGSCPDS